MPELARWLAEAHGVTSCAARWSTRSSRPRIETTRGTVTAESRVVCPGDDFRVAVPRTDRRLRPDPLQAAHAARRRDAGPAGLPAR